MNLPSDLHFTSVFTIDRERGIMEPHCFKHKLEKLVSYRVLRYKINFPKLLQTKKMEMEVENHDFPCDKNVHFASQNCISYRYLRYFVDMGVKGFE